MVEIRATMSRAYRGQELARAMTEESQQGSDDLIGVVLSQSITHVGHERIVLARYELMHSSEFPHPARGNSAFESKMNSAVEHLGGPPEHYLVRDGHKPPLPDQYPEAILRELMSVFDRARKSVVRSHMFMTGAVTIAEHPEEILVDNPEQAVTLGKLATEAFWEHAEAAYIRLASYWDRVGQVLDFAFFNIRKFDQNGFNAVMDRVATNAVPMNDRFKSHPSWSRLRAYQTSEKEDGLKWLLSRRNLIVHSLHLHPLPDDNDSVFESQFNHLDKAHREKLRPRTIRGEVEILTRQLKKAAELFPDFLHVVEFSPSRKVDPFIY
jgi:hypothetical protein